MRLNIYTAAEGLAFLGLLCCFFMYNMSLLFLGSVIAFVVMETIMEWYQLRLSTRFANIYVCFHSITIVTTSIMSNGFQLSSFLPLFFIGVLLAVPRISLMTNDTKKPQYQ